MAKFLARILGKVSEVNTKQTSAGATDADKIPSLNALGLLDPSMIPSNYLTVGKFGNEATISIDEVDMSSFGTDIFFVRITAPGASSYLWSTYLPQLSDDAKPEWRNRLLYLVNDSYEDAREVNITIFKNTYDPGSRIHVVGGTMMLNQFDLPPGAAVLLWSHYSKSNSGAEKWAWHVLNANITIPST